MSPEDASSQALGLVEVLVVCVYFFTSIQLAALLSVVSSVFYSGGKSVWFFREMVWWHVGSHCLLLVRQQLPKPSALGIFFWVAWSFKWAAFLGRLTQSDTHFQIGSCWGRSTFVSSFLRIPFQMRYVSETFMERYQVCGFGEKIHPVCTQKVTFRLIEHLGQILCHPIYFDTSYSDVWVTKTSCNLQTFVSRARLFMACFSWLTLLMTANLILFLKVAVLKEGRNKGQRSRLNQIFVKIMNCGMKKSFLRKRCYR